ncbi:MAG: hypothetical protein R3C10_09520 [Pirellulales bacterium]
MRATQTPKKLLRGCGRCSDFVGLELPVFADVASALEQLATQARQNEQGDLQAQFNQRLDTIAAALSGNEGASTVLNDEAAAAVDWLARHGQAGELVDAIHARYRRENVLVRVDGDLIRAALDRDIDETGPVHDNILGTRIEGTSDTTGRLRSTLMPSDDEAVVALNFAGVSESLTTGYNGPARIRSAGHTTLDAHTRLTLGNSGLSADDVDTTATTKTTTLGVSSNRGGVAGCLITKIARKKVAQKKGASQRVAADHAAERFSTQMDDRLAELVARVNDYYYKNLRQPLSDRSAFPDVLRLTTTGSELLAVALAGRRDQMAAPTAPPAGFDDAQCELRLHQSAINNLAEAMLAGEEFDNEQFRRHLTDMFGDAADRFIAEAGDGDDANSTWAIQFADQQPLTVEFGDDQLTLKIRGQKFVSNGRSYSAMDVTARYQLVNDGDTVKAVRQGDLEILPPDYEPGKRLQVRQITLKQLLERRLGRMLTEEIVPEPMTMTGELAGVGALRLGRLTTQNGWLAAGWLRESAPPASDAAETARADGQPDVIVKTAARD